MDETKRPAFEAWLTDGMADDRRAHMLTDRALARIPSGSAFAGQYETFAVQLAFDAYCAGSTAMEG